MCQRGKRRLPGWGNRRGTIKMPLLSPHPAFFEKSGAWRSSNKMINLTDDNFEKEIQDSKKPVLVDFFAEWCPPCQILSPILEKLEKERAEQIVFAKINVDMAPKTSRKFGINPIPTVILFKDGKPISGFVGLKPESEIRKWLDGLLK